MAGIYSLKQINPKTGHVIKTFMLPWECMVKKLYESTREEVYIAEVEYMGDDGSEDEGVE